MSISSPRIIALSATIPNIKEVAQWLKVSNDLILVFGE
jgi:replicative superfamily II helicase